MPLMQEDIRRHYEQSWKQMDDAASDETGLTYSNPVEDAVLYPIYEQLLRDSHIRIDGGKVLDVGAGIRAMDSIFTQRFSPALLMGVDFTNASIELLRRRYVNDKIQFQTADLANPNLDLGERFDLINVMNVLFHIPEEDRFLTAMKNLARHLAPGGRVVTTEYMPRTTMRTNWMLVRSRYEMEAIAQSVGLRIADVRATCIFSNDPMGIDGPDTGIRQHFNLVRDAMEQIRTLSVDAKSREFFLQFFTEIEQSVLKFCRERIAEVDFPSQKLVVLAAA